MEYLIKFGNKKIALSRTDIANLYPEIEPFFLAIMQGLDEVQTSRFVKEYKIFMQSLAENRKKKPLTTKEEHSIIEMTAKEEKPFSSGGAEIYDFNTRRKLS